MVVAVLGDWFPFLVYGLFALAIPASMILMSFLFATRPRRRARAREIPFESGVSTGPPQQQRFTISFYLTAMLFIVFDIEIVFLYPVAVQLVDIGWFAVAEFGFFIAILTSRTSTSGVGSPGMALDPKYVRASPTSGSTRSACSCAARSPVCSSRSSGTSRTSSCSRPSRKAVAWAQSNSIWPDTFGLACCAIEMMSIVSSRYDVARFGAEVFRSSPRQADFLIVSGRVSHKMAAPLRQIYDQMLEPKWVIAMGACASSGGMFNNYAVLQGVDKIVAVDIHIPAARRGPSLSSRASCACRRRSRPASHPRMRFAGCSPSWERSGLSRGAAGHGETTVVVECGRLEDAARYLRDEAGYDFLADIAAADYLGWNGEGIAGYWGTTGGRDINSPARGACTRSPSRSRSASRSRTTSYRCSTAAGCCVSRCGATTERPFRASCPCGRPPTGTSARRGTCSASRSRATPTSSAS